MSKFVNPTKVITGICTFSYLNCWEPKAIEGGKPKFSVSLVVRRERLPRQIYQAEGERQVRPCAVRHPHPAARRRQGPPGR